MDRVWLEKCSRRFFRVCVGQAVLVGPGGVAEDAVQPPGVGHLDGAQGALDGPADVLGHRPHVIPVGARGDDEALVGLGAGEVLVPVVLVEGAGVVLVPHVGEALEEQRGGRCTACSRRHRRGRAGWWRRPTGRTRAAAG